MKSKVKTFDPKHFSSKKSTTKKIENDVFPSRKVPAGKNSAKLSGAAKRLADKQI